MERGGAGLSGLRGALPVVLGLCLCSTLAFGGSVSDAPGGDLFQLGVRDEAVGDYAHALEHYRAAVKASMSGRLARNARNRIAWIEERSPGGFAPLAALSRVRHDPSVLDDPGASAQLAAETETFPPGPVRSEMRLRIAQAWLRQPARRPEAVGELRKIVSDPTAGAADAVLAERDLVDALLTAGQLDAAQEEVTTHPFDPLATAKVGQLLHRRVLRRGGEAGLVALTALAVAIAALRRGSKAHASSVELQPPLSAGADLPPVPDGRRERV